MTEKLNSINEILNSLQKNLKAPKDKQNKFGNFAYRNAEGILEAYKEEVKKDIYPNDLVLTHAFKIDLIGNRVFATCTSTLEISCAKKEAVGFAEIDVSKKGMDQSQLSGAVTSYAKKYALCNLFAIDDSKDDPDSDEKSKDKSPYDNPTVMEALGAKRNASGLKVGTDLTDGSAMKEVFDKQDEVFDLIKLHISNRGSIAELEAACAEKRADVDGLNKTLQAKIKKVKAAEIARINGEDPAYEASLPNQ